MVSRSVLPHDPCPIQTDDNLIRLKADVVKDLIIGPLNERGVHGVDRGLAPEGEPRCETSPVFLGDSHVKGPFRKRIRKGGNTRAIGHGSRHRTQPAMLPPQRGERLGEHVRKRRGRGFLGRLPVVRQEVL